MPADPEGGVAVGSRDERRLDDKPPLSPQSPSDVTIDRANGNECEGWCLSSEHRARKRNSHWVPAIEFFRVGDDAVPIARSIELGEKAANPRDTGKHSQELLCQRSSNKSRALLCEGEFKQQRKG